MKLDSVCNQIYIVALNEAKMQNHEYLTPEHFLYAGLMFDCGRELIERSGGNITQIKADLQKFFAEKIPQNTSDNPTDSCLFVRMLEMATAQAHSSGKTIVHFGNIIAAIFNIQECFAGYILLKNGVDRLVFLQIVSNEMKPGEGETVETETNTQNKPSDKEFLRLYTTNFTEKAQKNLLDPLIGREDILKRTTQVLSRRLKNNPIHIGDPGVGKTAIVEGLAQLIVKGEVPEDLLGSQLFYVDIGAVVAGTKYRGDFEERLIKLLEIIGKINKPIVYLDEIHTIVGAGAVSGGGMDATSIIKPYLSDGKIKFIGSTTFEEYKKYFEKDRALSRRFQRIDVAEPTPEECIKILKGIKHKYESFHNVIYTDEVIESICQLTSKYIQDRFLPDKAIDVMDETGAYVKTENKSSFTKVVLQKDIERTIALMAKIPENTVSASELDKLSTLKSRISEQIFGQDEAVTKVVNAIKASRSGLNDTEKPVASFLFVGPTGVGKTELAKQLAENLGIHLQRFDMSEYQEKHSVARLIGSPPGYVGYEEGGLLTEALRKNPHSVVLLDEIEKAHSDIYNVLLQVMDYGFLTDNTGKKADFRNAVLIMTSNAGASQMNKRIVGYEQKTHSQHAVDKAVENAFSPEFRNRLDEIVLFNNIDIPLARKIAEKCFNKLAKRLEGKKITVKPSKRALDYLSQQGSLELYGAREIVRIVEKEVKQKLVDEVLFGKLSQGGTAIVDYVNEKITVKCRKDKKEPVKESPQCLLVES